MKRLVIAATAVAMFVGTSAFAGVNNTATSSNGKATTENVLQAGKTGKMHKKHHAKHMRHAKKAAAETAPKAAPAKK